LSGGRDDHDQLFSDFVPPITVAERSTNDTILCHLRERTAISNAVCNTGLSEMDDLTNWQYFLPNDHKRCHQAMPPRINREDVTPLEVIISSKGMICGWYLWFSLQVRILSRLTITKIHQRRIK